MRHQHSHNKALAQPHQLMPHDAPVAVVEITDQLKELNHVVTTAVTQLFKAVVV
jgi:hypothetical protein